MKIHSIKCLLGFILIFISSIPLAYSSEEQVLKEISTNSELKQLDIQLNEYYAILTKTSGPSELAKLKIGQRNWLKERNKIGSSQNSLSKLEELYKVRITYLRELCEKVAKPIIEQLITDEENIDGSRKLQIIENCDLKVCKAYKFYFHLDEIESLDPKSLEFKNALPKLASEISNYNVSSNLNEFNNNIIDKATALNLTLSIISSNELYDDIRFLVKDNDHMKLPVIPIWLVKKYPEILENLYERFSPTILSKTSIHELPKFSKLIALMYAMEEGKWVTTSYMSHRGSIVHDIYSGRHNFINLMSFAPWLVKSEMSIKEKLEPLYAWSFEGIWNRKKFEEFNEFYLDTIKEMRDYYHTNYGLKDYSDKAEDLLASYVHYCLSYKASYSENNGYKLFSQPNISLDDLKIKSQGFNQEDWNIALSIAIVNHYPKSVIEWIIKLGADVNSLLMYETPLMKAVEQPEIVNLLLENGANPNTATPYGKTALFYAVQYSDFDSVKLPIASKANINQKIKTLKELEELGNEGEFLLEVISEYTPLIYSLRYSSKDVINFLMDNGASTGGLKVNAFKAWVLGNKEIDKDELNNILNSIELK